jgi:GntR family transcriptional regulator
MTVIRLNQSSGVPVYLQLMEQIKHAIETGALRPGDQLSTIRKLAEELVINPNTVVRAYRELEHEGVIEIRHGSGAFVSDVAAKRAGLMRKAQGVVQTTIERLAAMGLTEPEIRRLIESELTAVRDGKQSEG